MTRSRASSRSTGSRLWSVGLGIGRTGSLVGARFSYHWHHRPEPDRTQGPVQGAPAGFRLAGRSGRPAPATLPAQTHPRRARGEHARRDHMAKLRLFLDDIDPDADTIVVTGEEAEHARKVKRVGPGHAVTILDGRGGVIEAEVVNIRRELELRIIERRVEAPVSPRLEVYAAAPKGPRLDDMIDALSQVGAASWSPLETKLSVVDPRPGKLARQERIAREASKQCGRAWVMTIGARQRLEAVLEGTGPETAVVMADVGGERYERTGRGVVRLLIGPEGGWTEGEVALARSKGARVCSFGVHAMRIEVAAAVCAGVVMEREGGAESRGADSR
ncbi:MAG: 16S rRNA (uracil(1498)-N(3))-methyltransferase [Phycisphaerales bacterium]|nr:MAG: 16S rRNA (uracil(1498)-N(3))-methyltransferase [Phycisphaerales bacterium]